MKQQEVGTIVGSSVHLTGTIKDSSDITIFGSIEGEILSDQRVIIEESAHVKGPINANEVVISGRVAGTISAKSRLELNPTGTIKGNIDTSELLIHAGAVFIGECSMPDKRAEGEKGEEFFEAEEEGLKEKSTETEKEQETEPSDLIFGKEDEEKDEDSDEERESEEIKAKEEESEKRKK